MSKNDNQKLQAEEENNSKLFKDDVDYEQPSDDRPYVYWVGKTKLYVNLEQLRLLSEEKWQKKKEQWIRSRCLIPAERGLWKICMGKCEECPSFRNGWVKPTYASFEEMDEEEYIEQNPQKSILDKIIEEERNQAIYDAIDSLEDPIDRYIVRQFMNDVNDLQIARELGRSHQFVKYRKTRIFETLKKILKNF